MFKQKTYDIENLLTCYSSFYSLVPLHIMYTYQWWEKLETCIIKHFQNNFSQNMHECSFWFEESILNALMRQCSRMVTYKTRNTGVILQCFQSLKIMYAYFTIKPQTIRYLPRDNVHISIFTIFYIALKKCAYKNKPSLKMITGNGLHAHHK